MEQGDLREAIAFHDFWHLRGASGDGGCGGLTKTLPAIYVYYIFIYIYVCVCYMYVYVYVYVHAYMYV